DGNEDGTDAGGEDGEEDDGRNDDDAGDDEDDEDYELEALDDDMEIDFGTEFEIVRARARAPANVEADEPIGRTTDTAAEEPTMEDSSSSRPTSDGPPVPPTPGKNHVRRSDFTPPKHWVERPAAITITQPLPPYENL